MLNEDARFVKTVSRPTLLNATCALVIFIVGLFVYQSNGDTYLYAYDSAPNTLLVFNAIDHHRPDFENFRGGYFDALGAHYIFVDARDGRLASIFPVGAAILTAPLYAGFDIERRLLHQPLEITQPVFERYRLHYEKQAANVVAAVAAMLIFLCARRMKATYFAAVVVTVFFAFGTEMWVVGSQALWQHGPVNFVLLAMIYALLAASDAGDEAARARWLLLAGISAGFLPVVRPTSVLFLIAGSGFALLSFRRYSRLYGCGVLIGLAPGIVWNWHFFHTLAGGYLGNTHNYVYSLSFAANALTGLLVSPSKGLAITTPLVLFSIAGAIKTKHTEGPAARLLFSLSVAGLALVGTYAFYIDWWGGTNYGDRFLSDTAAISALLLLYVFPQKPMAFVCSGPRQLLAATLFVVLLLMSIGIQFVGANGEMESEWSAVPYDIAGHTERLWTWTDSQIQRDGRATYRKFSVNPALSPLYMRGLDARVTAIRMPAGKNPDVLAAAAGRPLELIANVQNRGTSPLYGFASGYWIGQARVRLQIRNAVGQVVTSSTLYLPNGCGRQAQAAASGIVAAPTSPGVYEMRADVIVNRIDDPSAQPRRPFVITLRLW